MRTTRAVSVLTASVVTVGLVAAPALANVRQFDDPTGDTKAHNDIRWVRVNNGGANGKRLVVKVRYSDVRPGDAQAIFVDTRARNAGPEWRMSANADSEWVLERVGGWNSAGTEMSCPGRVRLTDGHDTSRWRASRRCLGVGGKVRVAVRAQEATSSRHDWAKYYRTFLGWVNR